MRNYDKTQTERTNRNRERRSKMAAALGIQNRKGKYTGDGILTEMANKFEAGELADFLRELADRLEIDK